MMIGYLFIKRYKYLIKELNVRKMKLYQSVYCLFLIVLVKLMMKESFEEITDEIENSANTNDHTQGSMVNNSNSEELPHDDSD